MILDLSTNIFSGMLPSDERNLYENELDNKEEGSDSEYLC